MCSGVLRNTNVDFERVDCMIQGINNLIVEITRDWYAVLFCGLEYSSCCGISLFVCCGLSLFYGRLHADVSGRVDSLSLRNNVVKYRLTLMVTVVG